MSDTFSLADIPKDDFFDAEKLVPIMLRQGLITTDPDYPNCYKLRTRGTQLLAALNYINMKHRERHFFDV